MAATIHIETYDEMVLRLAKEQLLEQSRGIRFERLVSAVATGAILWRLEQGDVYRKTDSGGFKLWSE